MPVFVTKYLAKAEINCCCDKNGRLNDSDLDRLMVACIQGRDAALQHNACHAGVFSEALRHATGSQAESFLSNAWHLPEIIRDAIRDHPVMEALYARTAEQAVSRTFLLGFIGGCRCACA